MVRFIIRPQEIYTTPSLLRRTLNARRTLGYSGGTIRSRHVPDWSRDLFLAYPPAELVANAVTQTEHQRTPVRHVYEVVSSFARTNKLVQRAYLDGAGIPIPPTHTPLGFTDGDCDGRYIARPLRHSKGIGWRLTSNPYDYDPAEEYLQGLYPKTHEYRILFVFGEPLITLIKRVPESMPQDQPWNHANGSSFVTVTDWNLNRLRHTDIYDRLKSFDVIKSAHIVAADVLFNKNKNGCVVSELNFCPSITIPSNLERVKTHVFQVRGLAQQ